MKFGLKMDVWRSIDAVMKKYPEITKVYLFGSRAREDYTLTSDIDLAICSTGITSTRLNLLRLDLDDLNIIYKVDVVDMNGIVKEALKDNIVTEGVQIYP